MILRAGWLAGACALLASPVIAQVHEHAAVREPSDVPEQAAPAAPTDYAAEQFYAPAAMAAARAQLRLEHGGAPTWSARLRLAEFQARDAADGYRWDALAWWGGDIHRLMVKSEGGGTGAGGLDHADLQLAYSRAVGVYTDVQFGVRQDFEPGRGTYASVGFETLLPYWFEVEGAAYVSAQGEVLARLEGSYDARITNRLILQPRAEFNFAAQDTRATRTGSGLATMELGLRLRYELRREFAPYLGVSWEKQTGATADYSRAAGEETTRTSVVAGIRAFF